MVKNDEQLKNEIKSNFDTIEVPESLIKFAENVPNLVEKELSSPIKKKFSWKRPLITIGSTAAAVLLAWNVSMTPAFGKIMESLGVIWSVSPYQDDNGLTEASKHSGFAGGVTTENNGISFTVDEVIADKKRVFIVYHVTLDKKKSGNIVDLQDLWFEELKVTDEEGRLIVKQKKDSLTEYGEETNGAHFLPRYIQTPTKTEDQKDFYGFMEFVNNGETNYTPEELKISIKNLYEATNRTEKPNREYINFDGNWNLSVKLDNAVVSKEPKTHPGKKFSIEAGGKNLDLSVDYVKVFPTMTSMKIDLLSKLDEGKGILYTYHLEDENGKIYNHIEDEILTDLGNTRPQFESFYFNYPKELYLVFDKVEFTTRDGGETHKVGKKVRIF